MWPPDETKGDFAQKKKWEIAAPNASNSIPSRYADNCGINALRRNEQRTAASGNDGKLQEHRSGGFKNGEPIKDSIQCTPEELQKVLGGKEKQFAMLIQGAANQSPCGPPMRRIQLAPDGLFRGTGQATS